MNCQSCNSENTQRLQVAYEYGTQDISTQSTTTGIGLSRGGLGVGGAVTSTSGQSQSILAQKAAPPAKKPYKWPVIALIVGLLALAQGSEGVVAGLLFSGVGGYFLYSRYTYNSQVWPDLHQHWTTGWVCHKCGNIFYQSAIQSQT